jgi:hypothetical protein
MQASRAHREEKDEKQILGNDMRNEVNLKNIMQWRRFKVPENVRKNESKLF